MQVSFIEEIEPHKAWREKMACPKCNELKYDIHHQLEPVTTDSWWIACPNCGYESPQSPDKDIAIARWKQR